MPPQLLALTDGPSLSLDKPILLIGRHQECDIQIPSRKISRRHCCIAVLKDHLVARDLGSTNGIRVNGTRVLEGELRSGDELIIGNFKYKVQMNGDVPRPEKKQGIRARPPIPNLQLDHSEHDEDSSDIPIALDELDRQAKPILPTNQSNPPHAPPVGKQVGSDLHDIPHAIFPESMSLEPLSDAFPESPEPRPKK